MDDKTTAKAVTIYITNKICPQDIFKIYFTQYYNNNSVAYYFWQLLPTVIKQHSFM